GIAAVVKPLVVCLYAVRIAGGRRQRSVRVAGGCGSHEQRVIGTARASATFDGIAIDRDVVTGGDPVEIDLATRSCGSHERSRHTGRHGVDGDGGRGRRVAAVV